MSTIRVKKDRSLRFVQLFTSMFEDPKLSLKAKGLIGYCMTKIEDWVFYVDQLASVLKEKHRAIESALNECIKNGYAIRYQTRKENGDYGHWETIISDSKDEIVKLKQEMKDSGEFEKIFTEARFARAHFARPRNDPLPILDSNKKEDNKKKPPTPTPSKPRSRRSPPRTENGGGFSEKDDLESVIAFDCLKNLQIEDLDKRRISQDFTEEIVKQAVEHISAEDFKPKKTLTHALIYYCKNPSHIAKTEKQQEQELKRKKDAEDDNAMQNRMIYNDLRKKLHYTLINRKIRMLENSAMEYVEVGNEDDDTYVRVLFKSYSFERILENELHKLGITL